MKKTGLEIVEMIAKGEAPKKIKINGTIYNFNKELNDYVFDNYGDLEKLNILCWLNEEFEIIEEDKVWKPKDDEDYHYISDACNIITMKWKNIIIDRLRYEIGNCFKTKEEAQKQLEKIKIYTQLKRYAKEHNTEKMDWNNENRAKYFIKLYHNKLIFDSGYLTRVMNQIYFSSIGLCEQAIKEIGEDNIKKLFEEE